MPDSNYWRKEGERLVAGSKSASLPPVKKSEYFIGPDRDTAQVGSSTVSAPRYGGDKLSDDKGHLVGSVMSRMMQSAYDKADDYQKKEKAKRYYQDNAKVK